VLYERLGISQPTLSRLVAQLGVSILRFGKARQTQYALRRKIGAHETFPLYWVSASGALEQWGWLHPVMPEGYLVETSATSHSDARMEFHPGLPWYLQDMRPQGFLGRSFARFHGPMLGLPADPNRWSDDQTLLALAHAGEDMPGNLLVGAESAATFQTDALFTRDDAAKLPVPDAARLQTYARLSERALSGEVVGSSAGGEQPKFNCEVMRDGHATHVMVKFSAPQDNDATRRWRSLLVCEYLAFQLLGETLPASRSDLLVAEANGVAQFFLEVQRFDRIGHRGRAGVISLKALDDQFAGLATDWPRIAAALVQSGILSATVYRQVQQLHAFGVLIGNSDMHTGNLSFMVENATESNTVYTLAPVYDMLPMSLAPRPSGQIPDALPPPRIGINPPLEIWKEMLPLAIRYWQQVAAHPGVADDVREMAQRQVKVLSGPMPG
jgi:hypothetical protein